MVIKHIKKINNTYLLAGEKRINSIRNSLKKKDTMGPPGDRRGGQKSKQKPGGKTSTNNNNNNNSNDYHRPKKTGSLQVSNKKREVGAVRGRGSNWDDEEEDHDDDDDTAASNQMETKSLPIPLQQLLLNVFRCGLVQNVFFSSSANESEEYHHLSLSQQVQILKSHLFNRDFASAFTDADAGLLRAYALRWSAGRALCYAGVFAGVWDVLGLLRRRTEKLVIDRVEDENHTKKSQFQSHVVCLGGGGGAEIVGLAAAWRAYWGFMSAGDSGGGGGHEPQNDKGTGDISSSSSGNDGARSPHGLSVTAVDIADWSSLVTELLNLITSEKIPSSKSCPAPLLASSSPSPSSRPEGGNRGTINVSFKQTDILRLSEEELRSVLSNETVDMVTLMFTLNELFSTSLPKTTAFLLRLTEILEPGTILLVVDSPGSYSTVSFGAAAAGDNAQSKEQNQRTYPMRFLLKHALLTTAEGEWECLLSDESRWFRRDASRLRYEVGDGIGLEDMRFQIHVFRKLG